MTTDDDANFITGGTPSRVRLSSKNIQFLRLGAVAATGKPTSSSRSERGRGSYVPDGHPRAVFWERLFGAGAGRYRVQRLGVPNALARRWLTGRPMSDADVEGILAVTPPHMHASARAAAAEVWP